MQLCTSLSGESIDLCLSPHTCDNNYVVSSGAWGSSRPTVERPLEHVTFVQFWACLFVDHFQSHQVEDSVFLCFVSLLGRGWNEFLQTSFKFWKSFFVALCVPVISTSKETTSQQSMPTALPYDAVESCQRILALYGRQCNFFLITWALLDCFWCFNYQLSLIQLSPNTSPPPLLSKEPFSLFCGRFWETTIITIKNG